ncbi:proline-rich protein HaeIII subfamily 1-like [Rissa tridactyla]|uniref:proline-rich protein HaeIII subfamily 1-like n=1 Tax=Rissa tridactyla TaxID=75485 RepID=UPI0023BAD8E5|nr:proline-rich protein HaeIII subfamily 1-like [Rissa tridactyla]
MPSPAPRQHPPPGQPGAEAGRGPPRTASPSPRPPRCVPKGRGPPLPPLPAPGGRRSTPRPRSRGGRAGGTAQRSAGGRAAPPGPGYRGPLCPGPAHLRVPLQPLRGQGLSGSGVRPRAPFPARSPLPGSRYSRVPAEPSPHRSPLHREPRRQPPAAAPPQHGILLPRDGSPPRADPGKRLPPRHPSPGAQPCPPAVPLLRDPLPPPPAGAAEPCPGQKSSRERMRTAARGCSEGGRDSPSGPYFKKRSFF